ARLPELQVFESLRGGFELLDMLRGYDRAFVIDAIVTKRADPGTLWELSLEDLPPSLTLATSHEVDLPTAFKLGQELGYELPSQVFIWAIEVADAYTVAEELSPEVEAVVEEAVEEIISKIAGSD
ncbi:hydrogenase maturation protease, partial [Myxococcota bacterium]|nr:hydrogenase maturation protease [Myxococcota bacterium]